MIMRTDLWQTLELRHLLSLQAVARTGSFHGAADDLDYTQSAVSQHIASLERITGVRLVERSRGRRTISLTEAGELLVRHATAVLARIQAARADMASYADGAVGTLRVGTYQSVGTRVLPAVIGRFRAAWPGVEVRLVESQIDAELLVQVERGELDLTFMTFPVPPGPFETVELLEDPFVLAVPSNSPLAARGGLATREELASLPLIGFKHCRSTIVMEEHLRRMGVEPTFVFRSDDNGTVNGLVAAGHGAAMIPRLSADESKPGLTLLPTDAPPRVVAIAWHRDRYRSPAARTFVEIARDVCAEIGRELAATAV